MPRGPKPETAIALTRTQVEQLQQISRLRKAPYDHVLRAKILLFSWQHPEWTKADIARKVGSSPWTVWKWRKRWQENSVIEDAARPGGPRFFSLNPKGPNYGSGVHAP